MWAVKITKTERSSKVDEAEIKKSTVSSIKTWRSFQMKVDGTMWQGNVIGKSHQLMVSFFGKMKGTLDYDLGGPHIRVCFLVLGSQSELPTQRISNPNWQIRLLKSTATFGPHQIGPKVTRFLAISKGILEYQKPYSNVYTVYSILYTVYSGRRNIDRF